MCNVNLKWLTGETNKIGVATYATTEFLKRSISLGEQKPFDLFLDGQMIEDGQKNYGHQHQE